MPQLGPLEIIAVAVIALIVFGPHRLPEIARTLGRVISEFKRHATDLTSEFKTGLDLNLDDDDDDDEDIPEPVSTGLYATADDAEGDPAEPPLTAGAEAAEPPAAMNNGAPVQVPQEPLEAATGSESSGRPSGETGDPAERERDG